MKEVKWKKKQCILSIILSIVMIITIFPIMPDNKVSAAVGDVGLTFDNGDWKYTVLEDAEDGTKRVEVSGVKGASGEVTIPKSVKSGENEYAVTSIGDFAFSNCTGLTSISIPAGVTSIGDGAFTGCEKLATVKFADGSQLTSIGNGAFSWCEGLKSITIPAGVTSIDNLAFLKCTGLKTVTFEKGSQLTSIGDKAFLWCNKLETVTFEGESQLESIGNGAFGGCENLRSITIPEGVTSIGDEAFNSCSSLTSIEIPASVISIGEIAFGNCKKLETVTFEGENKLESIGEYAFWTCKNLGEVSIPNRAKVASTAFYECEILIKTQAKKPAGATSIGVYSDKTCTDEYKVQRFIKGDGSATGYIKVEATSGINIEKPKLIKSDDRSVEIPLTQIPTSNNETIYSFTVPTLTAGNYTDTYNLEFPQVEKPTFSVEEGAFKSEQTVTIESTTPGAAIYYTIDGEDPTTASDEYTEPILIKKSTTLKAVAVKKGMVNSDIAEAKYIIDKAAPEIKAKEEGTEKETTLTKESSATYYTRQTITVTDDYLESVKVKKDNEDEKTLSFENNTCTFDLEENGEYKITAIDKAGNDTKATVTLELKKPTKIINPTLIFDNGLSEKEIQEELKERGKVTIQLEGSDSIEADVEWENIDNEKFKNESEDDKLVEIKGTIILPSNVEKSKDTNLEITVQVTVKGKVKQPIFNPQGGTYDSEQTVTITSGTKDATIYYTIDGEDPTTASDEYTEPILIKKSTTLKAVAVKKGMVNSDIAEAKYIIDKAAPEIKAKEDGTEEETTLTNGSKKTYYTRQTITVTDKNLDKVTITKDNGETISTKDEDIKDENNTKQYTFDLVENGEYKITATDIAGKETTATVTISELKKVSGTPKSPEITFENGLNEEGIKKKLQEDGKVTIQLEGSGPIEADVKWENIDNEKFKNESEDDKLVEIKGTIILPSNVEKSKDTNLEITVQVTVKGKVKQPIFNPQGGTYDSEQTVTISSDTKDATIWYTTDGTTPAKGKGTELPNKGTVEIKSTTTLKAIAVKKGKTNSEITTAEYTIEIVPVKILSIKGLRDYLEGEKIDLSGLELELKMSNGTTKTVGFADFVKYAIKVNIENGTILNKGHSNITISLGDKEQQTQSIQVKAPSEAETVSTPTFSKEAGRYKEKQMVEIRSATEGAMIYYTTDGSTPTESSTVYKGAIEIEKYTELKAIAVKGGMNPSKVASGIYIINTANYKILNTNGSLSENEGLDTIEWSKAQEGDLIIRLDGDINKFKSIMINGEIVDRVHYTLESGSTIIKLKRSYIDTLESGIYSLMVNYEDGSIEMKLAVSEKSNEISDVLKTGDSRNAFVWLSIIILASEAMIILIYKNKKSSKYNV